MADNCDGVHSSDIERIRSIQDAKKEEFTMTFQISDKTLILSVNGVVRNRIKVNEPESKFEECLTWIKKQFISWRSS
jgi:hypothetical protein